MWLPYKEEHLRRGFRPKYWEVDGGSLNPNPLLFLAYPI